MTDGQRVVTVYRDVGFEITDRILSEVERALQDAGALRIWIDALDRNLTVMAEMAPRPAD